MISNETAERARQLASKLRDFHVALINSMKGTDHPEMIFWPAAEYLDQFATRIARTPADGPEPVAVKALEWKINTLSWKDTWEADSPIGGYSITESIEPSRDNPVEYCVYLRADYVCFKTSIDAAKAAAQADYETRIRSAITHTVPADGPADAVSEAEVLREAIRDAIDLLAERTYGNPARSPGHNARVILEAAQRARK